MRLILFQLMLFCSILYALWRGGKPERAVAIVIILMLLGDPLVHVLTPKVYAVLDPGHLIIDFLAWLALFAIALRAQRFWTLCVSSLQTISLISHVAKFLDYSIHPTAYGIMQVASSWPLLILLMVGTYNHRARLQRNGNDPPWRSSSPS